jgi:carboxyl-terminal processing protease
LYAVNGSWHLFPKPMPRRSLLFILAVGVFALVCYQKVQTNQYGRILSDSMELIDRLSLEKVDDAELFEGAMNGMVGRLGDEYSSYIPPKTLPDFREAVDQQFGGVGMQVSIDPHTRFITVDASWIGTPAHEAGVRAGDKILRIGSQSTQGMSLQDALSLMRGKPGEQVDFTVLHQGADKPVEINITRAVIQIPTVLGDTRNADGSWNYFLPGPDRIGYVRVISFADKTPADLKQALDWLMGHDIQGLILDLRENPGGLLSAAIEICDMFISSGIIVTTRGREGTILEKYEAGGKGQFTKFPMVVLVNHDSASASEIVAACLQDHRRATIVGQRTWGKGTVQQIIDLSDAWGALKLTTASYWRPSNKNIHRGRDAGENDAWGVQPDPGCEVVVEGDELTRLALWQLHHTFSQAAGKKIEAGQNTIAIDRQLAVALKVLKERIVNKDTAK